MLKTGGFATSIIPRLPVQEYCSLRFLSLQTFENGLVNRLDRLISIDLQNLSLRTIILKQVNGLSKKGVKAMLDRLSMIIGTLDQLAPIQIADACSQWRMRMHIVDVLMRFADP